MPRTLLVFAVLFAAAPVLGAAPREVAVVSVIWPGVVDDATAQRVEDLVRGSLGAAGVPLTDGSRARALRSQVSACGSKPECLGEVASKSGAPVLVRIEPAALSGEVMVLVQAFVADGGKKLGEFNLTVRAVALETELARALEPLAAKVRAYRDLHGAPPAPAEAGTSEAGPVAGATAPPGVATAATNAAATTTPRTTPDEARRLVGEPEPPQGGGRRLAGLVGGGAGLVAVAGGLALFATAGTVTQDAHGNVEAAQAPRVPGIQQRQATGLGLAVGGAVLGLAGALLWATSPRPPAVTVVPAPGGVALCGTF
jgi:hypothetical protein